MRSLSMRIEFKIGTGVGDCRAAGAENDQSRGKRPV